MNIANLVNKVGRGREPGKLRTKIHSLTQQANHQIRSNSGPVAAVKAGAHSRMITLLNQQLSNVLGPVGIIFGRRLKNAEARHPILMCFSKLAGIWYCCFFEDARKTRRLPRRITFRDPAKLWKAAKHGNADLSNKESRRQFENNIELGRGTIWLQLSDEQIATLSQ